MITKHFDWFFDLTTDERLTSKKGFLTQCVCSNYPEKQVEEEEHVFNAADATASHDCDSTGAVKKKI